MRNTQAPSKAPAPQNTKNEAGRIEPGIYIQNRETKFRNPQHYACMTFRAQVLGAAQLRTYVGQLEAWCLEFEGLWNWDLGFGS